MKLELEEKNLQGDLSAFYNEVVLHMIATYDCRKIVISKEVQEKIIEYYEKKGHSLSKINQLLLLYGPKVDHNLQGYEVEVSEGFLEFNA